jgi:DNA invertase Pin-like site-specific DNA recombinase
MVMDGSLNSKKTAVVLGLAAEIEREFVSARTIEALAKRKATGLPLGRPKGGVSTEKKLDKRKDEISELLKKCIQDQYWAYCWLFADDAIYLDGK